MDTQQVNNGDDIDRISSSEYDSFSDDAQSEDDKGSYGNCNSTVLTDPEHIQIFSEVCEKFRNKINRLRQTVGHSNGFEAEYSEVRRNVDLAPGYKERISVPTPATSSKNRYMNVLPLEDTRVRLSIINNNPSGDYINANYIDGGIPGLERAYIACSAPPPAAIADFWRMIWETKTQVVLMLTRFVEGQRAKADMYWECDKGTAQYSDITVIHAEDITVSIGYILREFKVLRGGESRLVRQVQLVTWPDHGVLTDFTVIKPVLELVDNLRGDSGAPVVVHCSAGIGRSGTIIAIDIILKRLNSAKRYLKRAKSTADCADACRKLEEALDIYRTVMDLRNQRPGMVQTKEQYAMIYEYIADAITSTQ